MAGYRSLEGEVSYIWELKTWLSDRSAAGGIVSAEVDRAILDNVTFSHFSEGVA